MHSNYSRENMSSFEGDSMSVVKRYMTLVGQWPFHDSKINLLKKGFISLTVICYILIEAWKLFVIRDQLELIIQVLPFLVDAIIMLTKYFTCWIRNESIKKILIRINANMDSIKSADEKYLAQKYIKEGLSLVKFFIFVLFSSTIVGTSLLTVPVILDIRASTNENCQKLLPQNFRFFSNLQSFYYVVFFQAELFLVVQAFILTGADIVFIIIVFHVAGMFQVLSYRFEHMFDDMDEINYADRESTLHSRFMNAVKYHWEIMDVLQTFLSCYTISYVVQLFAVVIANTCLLYHTRKTLVSADSSAILILILILILIAHYLLVFIMILPSERLGYSSGEIFHSLYNGYWYDASIKSQKLLLIAMQNTRESNIMNFLNMFALTNEMFAKIINVSFSYFMFLCALQE